MSRVGSFARTVGLSLVLGGCLLASVRERESMAPPPTLMAAKVHASSAAPVLPIVMLRTARDELGLDDASRANVAMIVHEAEFKSHVIVHARAAFLEILAQSVEEGRVDEVEVAIFSDQVSWAMEESSRPLRAAMLQLYDALTEEQRALLVQKMAEKTALWAPTWAASREHRWLSGFERGDLADFGGDLVRTGRGWADKSAANVRKNLPRLDPAARRALAASLRIGHFE
ncbi:MAG: hypothetical protein KIT84_16310 [Labilithrix sp.]|nr:hypothetical protein [Labilithrix sp.]MCW5812593.1 hypothetical protein [Labilithrix sp.]